VLQIGSLEGSNFNFGIDGTNVGNIARLLNHSCDANLEAKVVVQTDKNSPRCAFFSKRAIIVGDELTWTYARHSTGRVACGCGAANCRKWL
jgi:histone-lysine N-methyltransferase SETD1|tara:strand:- start:72 stop:344 length:273 start_codon:yes stop_codon:yes gene_type:complete